MLRRAIASCVLLALSTHASAQGQVWIVDDDGGPGVDFTDIPFAVEAAAATDVVIVRAGAYSPFTIDGKGLSVIGESAATVIVQGTSPGFTTEVSGVPPGQRAHLRGLTLRAPIESNGAHLRLSSSPGIIWIEDLEIEPAVPIPFGVSMNQTEAVRVQSCAEVVMTRAKLRGISGIPVGLGSGPETGARALSAQNATIYLFDCLAFPGATAVLGGPGREAIELTTSFLSLRDSAVIGGPGGEGGLFTGPSPGVGGTGVEALFGSEVYSIGSTVEGGPGGSSFGGPSGAPGLPFVVSLDSTLVEHAASNVSFDAPSVASDVTKKKLDFLVTTDPSSTVLLLAAFDTDPVFLPAFPDAVGVGLAPIILTLGTTGVSGELSFSFGTPFLPPSLESFDYTLQVAAITPTTGIELSNPSIVTLIQDTF